MRAAFSSWGVQFVLPGLQNLPEDWQCPTCGADKKLFVSKQRQVAGFAENQVRVGRAPEWCGPAVCMHLGVSLQRSL